MSSQRKIERTPTERVWLRFCLIIWILLLPVSALLAVSKGYLWKLLGGPVNALAGAFGAVVIGAYILQKWQDRITKERDEATRRDWLTRNLEFVLAAEDAIRAELVRIVWAAYHTYSILIPHADDRVPDDFIEKDLQRLPMQWAKTDDIGEIFRTFSHDLDEIMRMAQTGPVAVAEAQGFRIYKSLSNLYVRSMGLAAKDELAGEPEDAARLDRSAIQAMITASAHTAAEVEQASARILMLTGDMTAMEVFEPNELRRHAITISEEAAKLRPLHATNPDLRPTDQTNLKHAVSVVESAHKLVSSSMAIRKATYTHTKNLLELAEEIEGLGELFRKLRATIEHLSSKSADFRWSTWLRKHPQALQRHLSHTTA